MRAFLLFSVLSVALVSCGDSAAPADNAPVKHLGDAVPQKPKDPEPIAAVATSVQEGVPAKLAKAIERTKDAFDRADLYSKAKSLGAAGKPLLSVLQKGLVDAEGVARAAALEAIAAIDETAGAAAAATALRDKDAEVRMRALAVMDALPIVDIESVLAFVRDEIDSSVQLAGMLVVEKKLSAAQSDKVLGILGALDPKALAPAVRLVRKFGIKAAVPKLAGLVNCHDEDAREAVAGALAELGVADQDALKALVRALCDESVRVRRAVHAALKKLSGKNVPYNPEADEMDLSDAQAAWKEVLFGK